MNKLKEDTAYARIVPARKNNTFIKRFCWERFFWTTHHTDNIWAAMESIVAAISLDLAPKSDGDSL